MLRAEDNEVDHEHDPRDMQLRRNYIFNPCCCMTLTAGSIAVGIADIIIGSLDIGFTNILESNTGYDKQLDPLDKGKFDDFYPHLPPYSDKPLIRELERYVCSGAIIFMGLVLVIAVKWASYRATIVICTCWLVVQGICFAIQIGLAGKLLGGDAADYLHIRGYEIGVMIVIHIYFVLIVIFYTLATYEDLKDQRAIAPFQGNLTLGEDELHLQDINRIHGPEDAVDVSFGEKQDYAHMDVNEFRLQVAESRSSRLLQVKGPPKPKKNSYNENEYDAYMGTDRIK